MRGKGNCAYEEQNHVPLMVRHPAYSGGVTCNAVSPGFIETDMTADLADARREQVLANVPLGRFGAADEVAAAALFLASDAAAYISGAVLPVDGGISMGI